MKTTDITLKDLKRVFKDPFSLVMMVAAPLLISGLLYFAFGGLTKGGEGYKLPETKVVIANLDQPEASGVAAGEMLVNFFQDPELADLLAVRVAADEASARAAVDRREAGVALIIPAGFSQAATQPEQAAAVTLYQDPTLTIGPSIVRELANHFLDAFSGAKIAAVTVTGMLEAQGIRVDEEFAGEIARRYAAWQQAEGHESGGARPAVPGQPVQAAPDPAVPIGPIMAGMMTLFVFFIAGYGAESIIREAEGGTLARLMTSPTSAAAILGGKFLAVGATLWIQIGVLLGAAWLLFRIEWGQPVTVLLAAAGLVTAAAGFGILLMSFIKNSRQTGPVLGGVMTLLGLVGGLFSVAIPNLPAAAEWISLLTPQGWAMQAWKLALGGASPSQALLPVGVLFGMGLVFLAAGMRLFRRRFA